MLSSFQAFPSPEREVNNTRNPGRLLAIRSIVGGLLIFSGSIMSSALQLTETAYRDDGAGLGESLAYGTGTYCGLSQLPIFNDWGGLDSRCEPHNKGKVTFVMYPDKTGKIDTTDVVQEMASDSLFMISNLSEGKADYELEVIPATDTAIKKLEDNKRTEPDGTKCIDPDSDFLQSIIAGTTMPETADSTIVVGAGGGISCESAMYVKGEKVASRALGAAHTGSMNRLMDIFIPDYTILENQHQRANYSIIVAHELGHLLGLSHTSTVEGLMSRPTDGTIDINKIVSRLYKGQDDLLFSEYASTGNLMGIVTLDDEFPAEYLLDRTVSITAAQRVFLNGNKPAHDKLKSPYVQDISGLGHYTGKIAKNPNYHHLPYGLVYKLHEPAEYTPPDSKVKQYHNIGIDYYGVGLDNLDPIARIYFTDTVDEKGKLDTLDLGYVSFFNPLTLIVEDKIVILSYDQNTHAVTVHTSKSATG